jgi:hypothetical protein
VLVPDAPTMPSQAVKASGEDRHWPAQSPLRCLDDPLDDQTVPKHSAPAVSNPPLPWQMPDPPAADAESRTKDPLPVRRRWLRIGLPAGLVLALAAAAVVVFLEPNGNDDLPAPAPTAAPTPTPEPDTRPLVETKMGVFVGTAPDDVRAFADWLGREVTYAVDFSGRQSWAEISQPSLIDAWKGQPYRNVYSLAMLPADPADTIERGATGEYNPYYADLAQRLVEANQGDAILRVGWEFNLADSRWGSDDPAAFIAYWRHIVTTMRAQPGQQFQFDWNPNNGDNKYDAANYYPGSDVVDYIGIDAYDVSWAEGAYPYPENCDTTCRRAVQKIAWDESVYGGARGLRFWSRFAAKQGKPMSLPEWGLWLRQDQHGGGADPDYLRRMNEFIEDPTNRVAYHAYFEFNGPDGPHRLMTTFPRAGDVFRSLFAK